jgi:hypothetical protein
VDVFKQRVVVPVIHANSNQNRTGRFECVARHGADFFGGIDPSATRPLMVNLSRCTSLFSAALCSI